MSAGSVSELWSDKLDVGPIEFPWMAPSPGQLDRSMINVCWMRRRPHIYARCGNPVSNHRVGLCVDHLEELRNL